jgi:hypothetical protein
MENALDTASEDAINTITNKFVDEAKSQLLGSAESLSEALSALGEAGEKSEEMLEGQLGDIIDNINDVVDAVRPVLDVLSRVRDLLG